MIIPENISINQIPLPSIILFISAGFLYYLFIYWYEGKKDGFDSERLFDLAFTKSVLGLVLFIFLTKYFENLRIFSYRSFLLNFDEIVVKIFAILVVNIVISYYFSKKWKWSIYRILDIYSLAEVSFANVFFFGAYLIDSDTKYFLLFLLSIFSTVLFVRIRKYNYTSGIIFSFFTIYLVISGVVFAGIKGSLPFYFILFTISLFNCYFRRKKMKFGNFLPTDFLEKIKKRLLAKDADLKNQQELLKEQDPYMQRDRATGNAEVQDEAILEDFRKEVTDVSLGAIKHMRIQVRKALSLLKIGKYGVCEKCGKPIDKARLEFYPEATKCYECASKENAVN